MNEDVPVNNVGAGQVASLGVGPQGEPGGTKRRINYKLLRRWTKKNVNN